MLFPKPNLVPIKRWASYQECRLFIGSDVPPLQDKVWQLALRLEQAVAELRADRDRERAAGNLLLALLCDGAVKARGRSYDQIGIESIDDDGEFAGFFTHGLNSERLARDLVDLPSDFWQAYLAADHRFLIDDEVYYPGERIGEPRGDPGAPTRFNDVNIHGFFAVQFDVQSLVRALNLTNGEYGPLSGTNPDDLVFAEVAPLISVSYGSTEAGEGPSLGRPADIRRRAREAIQFLYPNGVPQEVKQVAIIKEIQEFLSSRGETASENTVRRALLEER